MEELSYTDFGGIGGIPHYRDRYGAEQVRVVNNVLRPASPDDPITNDRIYRLVDAFVTHHGTTLELARRKGKTNHKAVFEKAIETTADEFDNSPETIRSEYRNLYEQFDKPVEAFRDDLGTIADHLTDTEEPR